MGRAPRRLHLLRFDAAMSFKHVPLEHNCCIAPQERSITCTSASYPLVRLISQARFSSCHICLVSSNG